MATQYYGIRHHGAGSARSLKKVLETTQPDIVLIEGPPDAEQLIEHITLPGMEPPVAMLVYNPKVLSQAAFYPFTHFSPEWVAMQYALEQEIPVKFIDLPQEYQFALQEEERRAVVKIDPLSFIAEAAGYEDGERWWEVMIEQRLATDAVFDAVTELMTHLRKELNRDESHRDQLREAWMRRQIREWEGKLENVAVVCGAWHVPALNKPGEIKQDRLLLKGLKKLPVQCNWVPWTYERLSFQSGYGAGLLSPAWYELLYEHRDQALVQWFVKAARLLRNEQLEASSAHVIEAVRMAEALAAIRGLSIPGIREMVESVISIFCGGYDEPVRLVRNQLIIGRKQGSVPEEVEQVPLQQDIRNSLKKLRLKLSEEYKELALDLRKELHLNRSHWLHRMQLLNIPVGVPVQTRGKKGTFHEQWQVSWQPEYTLNVVEAGIWGNTLVQAVTNYIASEVKGQDQLDVISNLLANTLKAQLPGATGQIINRMLEVSALTRSVQPLLKALRPLVNILRYGDVRQTQTDAVQGILDQSMPRIAEALPGACFGLGEEAAEEMFSLVQDANSSINRLNNPEHWQTWQQTLQRLSTNSGTADRVSGYATRILFDNEELAMIETANRMSRSLSPANDPKKAAQWLEGFLAGNALLILNNPELWSILDEWVSEVQESPFNQMLPLLRRTFANFTEPERRKIGALGKSQTKQLNKEEVVDTARAERVMPVLKDMLGLA
jgi:hypothetical protein